MSRTPRFLAILTAAVLAGACSDGALDHAPVAPGDDAEPPEAELQERPVLASPFQTEIVERPAGDPGETLQRQRPGVLLLASGDPVVDDDGVECPDASFSTIQAAVDFAATTDGKDKIEICPGMYPENVTIGPGNPVELLGSGLGNTFITGVPGSSDPIIGIDMAWEVRIEKLTVDGQSDRSGTSYGIKYEDTEGLVKEVHVLNIRPGSGNGIGILGGSNVKVEKSLVQNYTRAGILVDGDGTKSEVKENEVIGPVPSGSGAPNGIQFSRGAVGKIENNFVDINPSPNPPGGAGSGIILFCPGPTVAKGNHVSRADLGISLVDTRDAKVENNLVEDSSFDGISFQFLGLFFGDIGCTAPGAPLPTEFNEVKKNKLLSSADDGISFSNFDPASAPDNPNDNKVEGNEIRNSGDEGIVQFAGTDNLIKKNTIEDSGGHGILSGSGPGNIYEENEIRRPGPQHEGINIQGADGNHVLKNKIEDAGRNGMRIIDVRMTYVDENDVKRSDAHGFRIDQSDENVIRKNVFKESGRSGIRLFASDDNFLRENKAEKSGDDGIRVFDNSEGNTFEKNEAKGSGDNSCDDDSVGGGTAGTANTWTENKGEAPDDPDGICPG